MQAAEARLKAVEEQNNLLHTQLASSADQPNAAEGDRLSMIALRASSARYQTIECLRRDPGQRILHLELCSSVEACAWGRVLPIRAALKHMSC